MRPLTSAAGQGGSATQPRLSSSAGGAASSNQRASGEPSRGTSDSSSAAVPTFEISGTSGTGAGDEPQQAPHGGRRRSSGGDDLGDSRRDGTATAGDASDVGGTAAATGAGSRQPVSWRQGAASDPRGGAFRRFREQTYDVFRPQPTLPGALAVLTLLFALGLGLGLPLLLASLRVVEVRLRYDNVPPLNGSAAAGGSWPNGSDPRQAALWAAGDAGVRQSMTLTVPRLMRPPIYLLYELEGLYGTHKRFVRSVSWEQLSGQPVPASSLDICQPRLYQGGQPNGSLPSGGLIDPCGLRATSLFNDTFELEADAATCGAGSAAADSVPWVSDVHTDTDASDAAGRGGGGGGGGAAGAPGTGRQSDTPAGSPQGAVVGGRRAGRLLRQLLLAGPPPPPSLPSRGPAGQPMGRGGRRLHQGQVAQPGGGDASGAGGFSTADFRPLAIDEHAIVWPLEAKHLYGMYNSSNLNSVPVLRTGGTLDEPIGAAGHFQVWMRPSARPTALKLYGILHVPLPAGCVLQLHVANRYNSYAWGGAKRLQLTTQSWYGVRNIVLPSVLLAIAGAALAAAALLVGLSACLPRSA